MLQDLIQSYEKQDAMKFKNVEIATVDGFQGREKEVFMLNLGLVSMSGTSSPVLPPSDSIQLITVVLEAKRNWKVSILAGIVTFSYFFL